MVTHNVAQTVDVDPATGQQRVTREVDIPDADLKEAPKIQLAPDVVVERLIRRYLRKDGVFVKDLHQAFAERTGRTNKDGTAIMRLPFTPEQAEAHVVALCEESGRKITVDYISGRPKAEPGWRLTLHVPGMQREEQAAPKKPEGEERLKIAEASVVRLEEKLDRLLAGGGSVGQPQPTKPLGQMNHAELDEYALANTIAYREISEDHRLTKAEKVEDIEAELENRKNTE